MNIESPTNSWHGATADPESSEPIPSMSLIVVVSEFYIIVDELGGDRRGAKFIVRGPHRRLVFESHKRVAVARRTRDKRLMAVGGELDTHSEAPIGGALQL